jgi:hypothetical protein
MVVVEHHIFLLDSCMFSILVFYKEDSLNKSQNLIQQQSRPKGFYDLGLE